ncbi:MAG: hypothetical protein ACK6DR_13375 [Gemmatimonas sp.]|uniref:hypothetical protein n=1 Tax=Gemmatimonas sp. TaxID=1962908 RepID=UPI00391F35CD
MRFRHIAIRLQYCHTPVPCFRLPASCSLQIRQSATGILIASSDGMINPDRLTVKSAEALNEAVAFAR